MSEGADVQGASANAVTISAEDPRSLSHDEPVFEHLMRESLHSAMKGEEEEVPIQRPTFSQLAKDFKQLRKSSVQEILDSRISAIPAKLLTHRKAKDLRVLPELDDIFPTSGQSSDSDVLSTVSTEDMNRKPDVTDHDGYDTPPDDERIADIRDERRYRLSLIHDYHPSRMSF